MEKKSREVLKEEPKNNVDYLINLYSYEGVKVFKSIRRAIRRGKVSSMGFVAPKRPFNNRKRTAGREQQLLKERLYGQVRARFSA